MLIQPSIKSSVPWYDRNPTIHHHQSYTSANVAGWQIFGDTYTCPTNRKGILSLAYATVIVLGFTTPGWFRYLLTTGGIPDTPENTIYANQVYITALNQRISFDINLKDYIFTEGDQLTQIYKEDGGSFICYLDAGYTITEFDA